MVQQENRLRTVPDEALREMLLRMAQTNAVGSPEYILVAGEMQARKNTRQQAAAGQPQEPPVIAELLTGVGLPNMAAQQAPQMPPQLPEDSGLGAMAAPNMEMMDAPQYAEGGIVAFQAGGEARSPFSRGVSTQIENLKRMWQEARTPTERQRIQREMENIAIRPWEGVTDPEYQRRTGEMERLGGQLRSLDGVPEAMPADVSSGEAVDKALAKAGVQYEPKQPPPAPEKEPPAGLAAIAAPRPFDQVFEMARNYAKGMGPAAETLPSVTDAVAQQKQAMQEAGFDFNLIKDQIAEVRAEKEQSKADRKDAINLRLLEAGLGIMAGESPHAFVNIGKGATPALKGLSDDIKEIKKIDRERDKAMRDLATADNQIAAGMGLSAIRSRESAMERIARSDESRANREANIAQVITSADTQRYVADQGVASAQLGRAEQREDRLVIEAQRQARELIKASPRGLTMSPEELEREVSTLARSIYSQMKALPTGKTPAGQARGNVVNGVYVPAGQ
jgi:hypothetical protein